MFTFVNNPNNLFTNFNKMKNLQTILEQKMSEKGWVVDQIADMMGRKRGGYYSGFERKTVTIWEFDLLSKNLNIEPNDFFEWEGTGVDKNQPRVDKNDTDSETEFLRGQIVVLNNQIDDLIKTIKNFSEKS